MSRCKLVSLSIRTRDSKAREEIVRNEVTLRVSIIKIVVLTILEDSLKSF